MNLTLLRWHILRRLKVDRLRTLLLLISIAGSASVLIAILHAADESIASFESALKPFQGGYEIRSLRGEIRERELGDLFRYLRVDASLLPLKEAHGTAHGSGREVALLGADLSALRGFPSSGAAFRGSACVGRGLRRDVSRDGVNIVAAGKTITFRDISECRLDGLAVADYSLLTDIALLERAIGELPLARILVIPGPEFEPERFREILREHRNGALQLVLDGDEHGGSQARKILSAFRLNILVVVALTFLVCGFVVFNAAHLSVRARVQELSTLRTLGYRRRSILALVLLEALVLGALGAALGLTLGRPLSQALSALFLHSAREIYKAPPTYWDVSGTGSYLLSFLLSCLVCLLGSLYPALYASRQTPGLALRHAESPSALPRRVLLLAGILLALIGVLSAGLCLRSGRALLAHVSALSLILAVVAVSPALLWLIIAAVRPLLMRVPSGLGMVALASVRSSERGTSISVAMNAVGLCLLIALTIMVSSFRQELADWTDYSVQADIFVRGERAPGGRLLPLPLEFVDRMASLPEVERLVRVPETEAELGTERACPSPALHGCAERVIVQGPEFTERPVRQRHYKILNGTLNISALRLGKELLLSESGARKLGARPGENVRLNGRLLRVGAIYKEFTSEHPMVQLDFYAFSEIFPDPPITTIALYLKTPAAAAELKKRIADPRYNLTSNAELRRSILELFDRTFLITDVMRGIIAVICGLGFVLSMLQVLWDRRRELRTVQVLGATRPQIGRSVLIEGAVLLLPSLMLGILAGLALAVILVRVLNPAAFGWSFAMIVTPSSIWLPALFLLACNLVPAVILLARGYRVIKEAGLSDE